MGRAARLDAASVAAAVLAGHPEQVERWRRSEPGAWGFLAGQAVLLARERLGRRLSEAERRAVWAATWAVLERSRPTT